METSHHLPLLSDGYHKQKSQRQLRKNLALICGGICIVTGIGILIWSLPFFTSLRLRSGTVTDGGGASKLGVEVSNADPIVRETSWSAQRWHPRDVRRQQVEDTEIAAMDQIYEKEENTKPELVDEIEEFVVVEEILGVEPEEESKVLEVVLVESQQEVEDELLGLKDSVGADPSDPDAVAFLVPLRGTHGSLGLRYGRPMKHVLENLTKAVEAETGLYPIRQDSSSEFKAPSTILVRDSQGEPDIARKLTQHFYDIHGTTRYFGFMSDEEAMEVVHWARVKAPGTRFVSPTASSPYLDSAKNFARVQPSASTLAKAVADLLILLNCREPLIVARASLHTDAFLTLLQKLRVKSHMTIHYYETSLNVNGLVSRVKDASEHCPNPCPILLLGHVESWTIIKVADKIFSSTWILPYSAQYEDDPPATSQSEVMSFIYRAYDDNPGGQYLTQNELLNPVTSVIAAAKALIMGKKRSWRGSYVVTANLPVSSLAAKVRLVGTLNNTVPLLQYDITKKGLVRRVYQELFVTPEVLKSLVSSMNGCQLVVRYVEEMTGQVRTYQIEVNSVLPSLVIPAERGAQLHVDCPKQHANLVCKAPSGSWSPVTCQGTLQGSHGFKHQCGQNVGVAISATRGCSVGKGLLCKSHKTLGCLLSGLCVSNTHSPPIYSCDGIHLDSLT